MKKDNTQMKPDNTRHTTRVLHERSADMTTSKNHSVATVLDPRFKMNFFTNQLQEENTKQFVLIDRIKMSCEETGKLPITVVKTKNLILL
ncbi:hypothetical protein HHI36_012781, partial [Cryptolaemus montrouzieri]